MADPAPMLPAGYELATVAKHSTIRTDRKSGRAYTVSVQLLNRETFDIPRGVGVSIEDAIAHAISNVGGDDGLSKAVREAFQGPLQ